MIFVIKNYAEAPSLFIMTLKGHSESFKMFSLSKFHHSKEKEQLPGRFSAMVQIYQSQLGKNLSS